MSMSKQIEDYFKANQALWDAKTPVHIESEFYDIPGFLAGNSTLREVELNEVGEVRGKTLLHLQCHFGLDTLSWAREGAIVTGVDFSQKAIAKAREMASEVNIEAEFVEANIYDLPEILLDKKFDIVFTSYGTIGWLPDLDRWAHVINHFLSPGGTFYIVDFHPFIWMYDYDLQKIEYPYFNAGVIAEENEGTYADPNAPIKLAEYGWNHPSSEVINSLINQGLEIEFLNEFPYTTWNCFKNLKEIGKHKYVFKHLGHKIPYMFSIRARKGNGIL